MNKGKTRDNIQLKYKEQYLYEIMRIKKIPKKSLREKRLRKKTGKELKKILEDLCH